MKKLVWLSFAILLLASACTTYTCPTYADTKVDDHSAVQVQDKV